jgi:hypothetical protein
MEHHERKVTLMCEHKYQDGYCQKCGTGQEQSVKRKSNGLHDIVDLVINVDGSIPIITEDLTPEPVFKAPPVGDIHESMVATMREHGIEGPVSQALTMVLAQSVSQVYAELERLLESFNRHNYGFPAPRVEVKEPSREDRMLRSVQFSVPMHEVYITGTIDLGNGATEDPVAVADEVAKQITYNTEKARNFAQRAGMSEARLLGARADMMIIDDSFLGRMPKCDCGGAKLNTTHSTWCSAYKPSK